MRRLDVVLAEREGVSRSVAQQLIDQGLVTVNGRPGRAAQKIDGSEVVALAPAPVWADAAPGPAVELNVLYEDESLAVIDKPAGLVVHPAPGHRTGTLADGLRQRGTTWSNLAGDSRPGIVHRLDKETSGLLVVAKTDVAHAALSAQLQQRTLGRTYWALVHGGFQEDSGTVDAPLGRDLRDRKKMAIREGGREAISEFRVVDRLPQHTRLDVSLKTGRTHQIRVHCAYIQHPIVGDHLYGRKGDVFPRPALHARQLKFMHPENRRLMTFDSPIPPELVDLLHSLSASPS